MEQVKRIFHPLSPIVDTHSKVLILGSFPSVISREKHFYYANSNNRFWKVMETLFHEKIIDRAAFCHVHHIALWDVIASCTIEGSKDSSIQHVQVNDILSLLKQTEIHTIFFTGQKAYQLFHKYMNIDVENYVLPSTSSANAKMHLEDLVHAYTLILEKLDEEKS